MEIAYAYDKLGGLQGLFYDINGKLIKTRGV